MSKKGITINDIAREAGVSKTTVSFALNDRYKDGVYISEELRQRVKLSANKLGYIQNNLARQISQGKSNVIAYFSHDIGAREYIASFLSGLMTEAAKENYYTKLIPFDFSEPKLSIRRLLEQRPAGIICRSVLGNDFLHLREVAEKYAIPLVSTNEIPEAETGYFTISDDRDGISQVVKHLYKSGHRKIAFLGPETHYGPGLRCEAFSAEMQKLSRNSSVRKITKIIKNQSPEIVGNAFLEVMKTFTPTAVVCPSDYIAMAVIQYAHKAMIKIPEDISVTGFSDLTCAAYSSPALTSVRHLKSNGAAAVCLIMDILNGKVPAGKKVVKKMPVELVVRESTGPAPKK